MTEEEKVEKNNKVNKAIYSIAGFVIILFVVGYFVMDNVIRNYYKNNPYSQIINELNKAEEEKAKKSK